MRILVADDDPATRRLLESRLTSWGHAVEMASDGTEAWTLLDRDDAAPVAILDWMMPGLDGPAVCRKLRGLGQPRPVYVILLTARGNREDIVEGFEAGADDFVTKPFDAAELAARVRVGVRTVELDRNLAERVRELEAALAEVRQLQKLLPMCSYCKKIRDDQDYWYDVERYIERDSTTQVSHGICPDCYEKHITPQLEAHERPNTPE